MKKMFAMMTMWVVALVAATPVASAQEWDTVLVGDMVVDVPLRQPMAAAGFSSTQSAKWAGGIVPMTYASTVSQAEFQWVLDVCNYYWGRQANVRCVARTSQVSYVHIAKIAGSEAGGCQASIGGPRTGQTGARTLNLQQTAGLNCWTSDIVIHELGHTFGFWHEHMRFDRDDYFDIQWSNIAPDDYDQFARVPVDPRIDTWSIAYDFDSIMHYPATGRSANLQPTIVPKPQFAEAAKNMGKTKVPSNLDLVVMRAIYGKPAGTVPGAPTLTLESSVNPIAIRWAPNASGAAPTSYTLVAGSRPGANDFGSYPMGTATSLTAYAPLGVPLYLRIVASSASGSATSNEIQVTARTGLTMATPVVQGRTVTLAWSGATRVTLLVRFAPGGPVAARFALSGSSLTVRAAPGTYYLSVTADGSTESNQVTLVVR